MSQNKISLNQIRKTITKIVGPGQFEEKINEYIDSNLQDMYAVIPKEDIKNILEPILKPILVYTSSGTISKKINASKQINDSEQLLFLLHLCTFKTPIFYNIFYNIY